MTSLQRPDDELANLATHGSGFLASLVASTYLMWQVRDRPPTVVLACGAYCVTLILVYAASTLSHAFYDLQWRKLFRTVDQASIFLLIAGSYTPFAAEYLWHGTWPLLLAAMWVLAILGAIRVVQVQDLAQREKLLFGGLGLLPATTLGELSRLAPTSVLAWVLAGGACYGMGAPFLRYSAVYRYSHAAWHVLVMAGSACHYIAILQACTAH